MALQSLLQPEERLSGGQLFEQLTPVTYFSGEFFASIPLIYFSYIEKWFLKGLFSETGVISLESLVNRNIKVSPSASTESH